MNDDDRQSDYPRTPPPEDPREDRPSATPPPPGPHSLGDLGDRGRPHAREAARKKAFEAAVLSGDTNLDLPDQPLPDTIRAEPDNMRLRCYLIGNDQPLQPVKVTPGENLPGEGGMMHWVDIEGADRDLLDDMLNAYDLHALHVDAFTDPGQVSRLVPVEGALFLEFSVLAGWERSELRRLSILHRKDLLLTVHSGPIPGLEDLIQRLTVRQVEWARDTSALLYHLLDHLVDDTFQFLMTARQMITELNDLFDEAPDELEDQDIHGTRRAVSRLGISCEDQYYVISAMQAMEQEYLHLDVPREYLSDLLSHAEYANRYAVRLDDRAKELKFLVSTTVQQRSEDRLRTLTIIMAVFNPLTFIAGIYGMNFQHMPELGWENGYFYSLGLMGFVALVLMFVFWRRGWFD